ncbi:unnamed protein product [Bursaphelenchus okinawaensis]|uniref:5'-deoxynucleotidase HDDC2 n=1 Tax=Bursaphelenchus okinawaensis TaxID=465554 RepID=A0A811LR99_9BILA|nr:unnamed protein product [Bursaphelenchus okinawaensis]CAG9126545.1 unnamed protein product [Bursaphelenchus okinawaensis]
MAHVDIFSLLQVIDNLKHLKRTGWVHHKVPEPETVASHMYRMAVLAMTLDSKEVDVVKCVKMTLVHDIGEAIVGDITPKCGVSDKEKFKLEEEAVKTIASYVPSMKEEWYNLWMEYEKAETKEAKTVKQLDKFDMVAQALSYEQKYNLDLSDFFRSTEGIFTSEPFISWDREVRQKRKSS